MPPLAVSRPLTSLAVSPRMGLVHGLGPILGLILGLILGPGLIDARVASGLEPPAGMPQPARPAAAAGTGAATNPPEPALADEVSALRDDVGALWLQLDRLTDGEQPPRWATEEHARLDRRLERVTTMLERLSARVETPVPRLDEPITLLTVALCTLFLGFLAGRALGRRNSGRDSRFRL